MFRKFPEAPEHWLGKVIDWVMLAVVVIVTVGCPMWAVVHFWP